MSDGQKASKGAALVRAAVVDGSILAGGALLSYGAWLAFHPAGFAVAGTLLLGLGLKGARS